MIKSEFLESENPYNLWAGFNFILSPCHFIPVSHNGLHIPYIAYLHDYSTVNAVFGCFIPFRDTMLL